MSEEWLDVADGRLPAMLFELWRNQISGVATVASPMGERELLFLRRGMWVLPPGPAPTQRAAARLEHLMSWGRVAVHVDVRTTAHPPLRSPSVFDLGAWARQRIISSFDGATAARFARDLKDHLVAIRGDSRLVGDGDCRQRIAAALERPISLPRLEACAACSKTELLALLYFLLDVGALELTDVRDERQRARETLGVSGDDLEELRSAYRTQARTLHPDLWGELDSGHRRDLESRLAQVNHAYEVLLA